MGGDTHISLPMIFADINWLNISINLLLVVFVIVCLLMALIILMQRPKQEGLGAAFGGGVTDQVFGARTTNVLQRGTVYLGSMFFILALTLAILIGKQTKQRSLLDPEEPVAEAESSEVPMEQPKSLAEELPVEVIPTPAVEETPAPAQETPSPEEAPAEEAPAEAVEAPAEAVEAPAETADEEPAPPAEKDTDADEPE